MDTSVSSVVKQGKELAQSAYDEAQDLSNRAIPLAQRAVKQARSIGKQGVDVAGDMAGQARDAISDASDAIIAFTKKNPAKALGIAAAAGVVAYALIRALVPSRE